MLAQGGYLWNAGIFLFSVKSIVDAFQEHEPGMVECVSRSVDDLQMDLGFMRLDPESWNRAQSISIDIPPLPLPTGLVELPPGLPATADNLESRATSTTAKLDAWLLPFLNVYGVAGYVGGETSARGFSLQPLTSPPIPAANLAAINAGIAGLAPHLPNSFSIAYSGPVYGVGVTLAAGYNQYFASVDANYTESHLDIGDSTIEAFVIAPRVGITGELGGLNGSLYVGAMYQDIDENQNGTVKFELPTAVGIATGVVDPVPVGYKVVSQAEEQWNYLVGANLKPVIRLAASGKVNSGASIAMNAALGADWCNAARAFMFALGCVQSLRCHTDTCPTGIATQSPARQRALVIPEKAERVARFQRSTLSALHDMVVACGLNSPDEFTPDSLRQRISAVEMRSMDELYPFVEPGELLDGARDARLARWWAQADPESFKRRIT